MVTFPRIAMDTTTNEVRSKLSLVADNRPKNVSEGNGRRRASQSAANVSRAVYTIRGRFQVEEREKEEPGLSGPSFREESGEKARRNKGVESLEANRPPPPPSLDSTYTREYTWCREREYTSVRNTCHHGAPVLERYFKDVTVPKLVRIHGPYNPAANALVSTC